MNRQHNIVDLLDSLSRVDGFVNEIQRKFYSTDDVKERRSMVRDVLIKYSKDFYIGLVDDFFTDVYTGSKYDPEIIFNDFLTISVKGDYVLVNYSKSCQFSRSWCELTLTSRGIAFDMTGFNIVAYPFDKFFNIGEYGIEHRSLSENASLGFHAVEKIDGALGFLYYDKDDGYRISTKGSFYSEEAQTGSETFTKKYGHIFQQYPNLGKDYTFIFEIITNADDSQHIIEYPEDDLYLLGIRNINAGSKDYLKLYNQDEVNSLAETYGFLRPGKYTKMHETVHTFLEEVKFLRNTEGYVLYFEDGTIAKAKTEHYCELHRSLCGFGIGQMAKAIRDGNIDEYLTTVPEEFIGKAYELLDSLHSKYDEIFEFVYDKFNNYVYERQNISKSDIKRNFFVNDIKNIQSELSTPIELSLFKFLIGNIEKINVFDMSEVNVIKNDFLKNNAVEIKDMV